MMVFLLGSYIAVLAMFVWLKFIPFNTFWKVSPLIVLLLLNLGLFIPMSWGAPQGSVMVARHSVAIIPDVAGEVLEVPVEANKPLKAGEVLFRIDPVPYQAQVDALQAQFNLQTQRLAQMTQLQTAGTGRGFDVEQRQAEVDQLKAQLAGAKWNLDKTVVRAPGEGYVTNVALRKGARVATTPVMAFIDTSETLIGVEISQIDARYVLPGQLVEMTFKFVPGAIYTGKVETVLQAVAAGQVQTSGTAVAASSINAVPFVVRVKLDDAGFANRLPAGATGSAEIYTDHVKVAHVIRGVMLRQVAILNYINPF
jgi:RND family efflux transporter MFP subunit